LLDGKKGSTTRKVGVKPNTTKQPAEEGEVLSSWGRYAVGLTRGSKKRSGHSRRIKELGKPWQIKSVEEEKRNIRRWSGVTEHHQKERRQYFSLPSEEKRRTRNNRRK